MLICNLENAKFLYYKQRFHAVITNRFMPQHETVGYE